METYQIKRTKRKRIRTDYILLVPSVCFLEGNFQYSPLFLNSGGKYIWDKWEKYLIKDLGHEVLPCNYFFTRVNEDYLGIVGCPYFHPSYFVEDLVQAGVIDYKYLHSIVIMLDFNFNLYIIWTNDLQHNYLINFLILYLKCINFNQIELNL